MSRRRGAAAEGTEHLESIARSIGRHFVSVPQELKPCFVDDIFREDGGVGHLDGPKRGCIANAARDEIEAADAEVRNVALCVCSPQCQSVVPARLKIDART